MKDDGHYICIQEDRLKQTEKGFSKIREDLGVKQEKDNRRNGRIEEIGKKTEEADLNLWKKIDDLQKGQNKMLYYIIGAILAAIALAKVI